MVAFHSGGQKAMQYVLPASKQIPQVATHWAFEKVEGAEEEGIVNLKTAKLLFSSSDPNKWAAA